MKTDSDKLYFLHILEAIEKLELVVNTYTKENFLSDWLKQDAVLKNFIVIGEAVAQIDEEFKLQNPEVEWRGAKSMRNFIVHEYFSVDLNFVWKPFLKLFQLLKVKFKIF